MSMIGGLALRSTGQMKCQPVREGSATRTVFRPVVLTLHLTPEQKSVVARYTGRQLDQLDLSSEDLLVVSGSFVSHQ